MWAGFYHMSRACLEQAFQEVEEAERALGPSPALHNTSLMLLLRGALCAQLGRYDQAYQCFDKVAGVSLVCLRLLPLVPHLSCHYCHCCDTGHITAIIVVAFVISLLTLLSRLS